MKKRDKIIYWIATIWLALGMVSSGIVQLIRLPEEVVMMANLGYQPYFMIIIGTWKLLGVIVVLLPRLPLLKEWAYAGFFFAMSGAIFSHLSCKHDLLEMFGPSLLLALTVVSWYFRPPSRRLTPVSKQVSIT